MIITRKIEILVYEKDAELRQQYWKTLYDYRYYCVCIANMAVSHLFALDHTMPYLSDEDKEAIQFLGVKGTPSTRKNAPYVVASREYKGKVNTSTITSLLQQVRLCYQDDKKRGMWKNSLRSYKSSMPVPFKATQLLDFGYTQDVSDNGTTYDNCHFKVFGIPFVMRFGRDRSNNEAIVKKVLSGEFKMHTSSIQVDDRKKKAFLILSVDMPKREYAPIKDKKLYAFLGELNPITYAVDKKAKQEYDSGLKVFTIGTKEEFNYRRRQIQEAMRRCQINSRYSVGGKGRKKKTKAIERWHDKETNYVDTKLHTYTRMLVDAAVKNQCSEIVLMRQTRRENEAKEENQDGDNLVLRNWSYFGLKEKLTYKCKQYGITITEEK